MMKPLSLPFISEMVLFEIATQKTIIIANIYQFVKHFKLNKQRFHLCQNICVQMVYIDKDIRNTQMIGSHQHMSMISHRFHATIPQ